MPDPLVSIIVPVFNAASYVTPGLSSLLSQTYPDIEVVVVDDHSTDDSLAVIEAFAADPRVTVVRLPRNGGVAAARNAAVAASRGAYLWFVDIDDQWSERFVETMVHRALATDADMVMCSAGFVFGAGLGRREAVVAYPQATTDAGFAAVRTVLEGTGALWNKLIRRACLPDEPFPPLRSKSDHGGVLRMLRTVRSTATMPDELYTYVQRDGSISNGGIAQPQNFLALLPLADEALSVWPPSRAVQAARSRFRCEIAGRAIRECWRFNGTPHGDVRRIARTYTWTDLMRSARAGRRTVVTCAAAKLSAPLARRLFLRIGQGRWTPKGALTA